MEATVTDAHVVLGRIAVDQLAGGQMLIDRAAAERAVARVAESLGLTTIDAAAAILRVANSNMERAIRAVSVERGEDPREFPLVAFGGCGGLHACEIAEELGITTVIVPRLADVRYQGQSYELTIPFGADFHKEHQRVYGYSDPNRATQFVTLRVRAAVRVEKPSLQARPARRKRQTGRRIWLDGRWREVIAVPREGLGSRAIPGPALIADYGSTTLVSKGWTIRQDRAGSLILHCASAGTSSR